MAKPRETARMGWLPDLPDQRDLLYSAPPSFTTLPPVVDLRPNMQFPVFQQAELGSCTANALGVAMQYNMQKQGLPGLTPSRLFIYWNERYILGTTDQDSGAMLRDGIKSLAKDGAPPENPLLRNWFNPHWFMASPSKRKPSEGIANSTSSLMVSASFILIGLSFRRIFFPSRSSSIPRSFASFPAC